MTRGCGEVILALPPFPGSLGKALGTAGRAERAAATCDGPSYAHTAGRVNASLSGERWLEGLRAADESSQALLHALPPLPNGSPEGAPGGPGRDKRDAAALPGISLAFLGISQNVGVSSGCNIPGSFELRLGEERDLRRALQTARRGADGMASPWVPAAWRWRPLLGPVAASVRVCQRCGGRTEPSRS